MKSAIKKILSLSLCALMLMSALAACNSSGSNDSGANDSDQQTTPNTQDEANTNENEGENESETPDAVTVEHAMGTTEVPFSPERVCILDSSGMDMMVALGLTDYVTCVQQPKGYASYLTDYYTSDTIIKLESTSGGGGKGKGEVAEDADPYAVYKTIDADLIIGDIDSLDEEAYNICSQIAPTIVLGYTIDNPDGVYAGAKENARKIASIWGKEDELDAMLEKYDEIYEDLGEALNGKTGIVMTSTSSSNLMGIAANDGWETDSEKLEYERSVRILFDLGMKLYSNDTPEEVVEASFYNKRDEDPVLRIEKNKVIAAWIEETNPDYLIDVDRYYTSLEEAAADGYAMTDLEGLTLVQEGRLCMMSYDGRIGSNGLYGLMIQMDELAAFFLD